MVLFDRLQWKISAADNQGVGAVITRIHGIILGVIATYGLILPCATFSQAAAADWAPTSTHAHPLERSNARILSSMAANE
jgi:hypothetical protein